MPDTSGIVLAGGQSRRLGTDKAFIEIDKVPLIGRVVNQLRPICDDVLIVTNDPGPYRGLGLPLVGDIWPGMGPLGGIYSGLLAIRHSQALVVGCDMPFLDPRLLRFMILLSAGYDAVVPRIGDLLEPLHAVYSRTCLSPIESLLRTGNLRIVDLLSQVQVRYLTESEINLFDPHHLSLFNINTPEDLARAQKLASCHRP